MMKDTEILLNENNKCIYIYTVQILEKFDDNWTIARGALDASITSKESKQSKQTNKKSMSVKVKKTFPYGFSNGQGDDYVKEDAYVLIGSKFPA